MPRLARRLLRIGLILGVTGIVAGLALRLYTINRHSSAIFDRRDVPPAETALVFGAGILPSGEATAVLYDRVAAAAELYRTGKVRQILLSGDGRTDAHDEPDVMRRVALQLGVPDAALLLDRGGLRTAESCRRANKDFGLEQAILVTQRFHLPRALLLCRAEGIDAVGVAGDRRPYPWRWRLSWQARETVATAVAWLEMQRSRIGWE